MPPADAECPACGQALPRGARSCWACRHAIQTFQPRSVGLGALGSAVVVVAVFAVILMGTVVLVQRETAIAWHESAVARGEAAASAEAETARQAAERERRIAAQPSPTPIPSDAPGTYRVRDGDSLFEIAATFSVAPDALREWNRGTYPTLATGIALSPGWIITVSGPAIAAAPAAPPDPVFPPGAEFVAAGGVGVIDADDVVVRTRPSRETDSRILGSLDTGTRVAVIAGPVAGSGYFWYQIRSPALEGWVAAGTATDAWIVAAPVNAPTSTGTAAIPEHTASITGATIRYYEITGGTHIDLIGQAHDLGPDSAYDDAIASANISFTYEAYLATESIDQGPVQGLTSWPACRVTASFEVILPRWVGPSPANAAVVQWWAGAFSLARDHEARHVAIWQEHLPALLAQTGPDVVDSDCWQAKQLTSYWLQVVGVVHDNFHLEEEFAGRTWPPPYPAP